MKSYGRVQGGNENKWLNVGGDPHHDLALMGTEVTWKRFSSGIARLKLRYLPWRICFHLSLSLSQALSLSLYLSYLTFMGTQSTTMRRSAEDRDTRNVLVTVCMRLFRTMAKITSPLPRMPRTSVSPYTMATGTSSSIGMYDSDHS